MISEYLKMKRAKLDRAIALLPKHAGRFKRVVRINNLVTVDAEKHVIGLGMMVFALKEEPSFEVMYMDGTGNWIYDSPDPKVREKYGKDEDRGLCIGVLTGSRRLLIPDNKHRYNRYTTYHSSYLPKFFEGMYDEVVPVSWKEMYKNCAAMSAESWRRWFG